MSLDVLVGTGATADVAGRAPARAAVAVTGWGAAVPAGRVTNTDLEASLETSDEWITARTGIHERRWATEGETTGPLAAQAAGRALAAAGVEASAVDLVVVATCTPELPMPSTAAMVAAELGTTAGGFDVNAACAGYPYALATAASLVAAGAGSTALVIGADTMSRVVDHADRNTAVLFGDGAAALLLQRADGAPVLQRSDGAPASADAQAQPRGVAGAPIDGAGGDPAGSGAPPDTRERTGAPGLLATDLVVDAAGSELLVIPAGGARTPASEASVAASAHTIRMQGRELFRQAVRAATASIERTLAVAGIAPADVALFVPHQANARITDAVLTRTGLTAERTATNLASYGNTSAASIPLAWCEAADAGRLADGDLVLVCGFGAGLTVGTALWRWDTGGRRG